MERPAERRLITAMFVDVVGSTDLQMRMGPERMKRAIDSAFAQLHDVITAQGGTVEKFIGDAVFAVFGAPNAHEDDVLRALRAADGCVRWAAGTSSSGAPFAVRVGLETGEALVDVHGIETERQQMAVGTCVNTAARLQQLADPMKALVGPVCREAAATVAHFEDLGERDLKGIGRVRVYELARIEAAEAQRTRLPFVGRDGELEMLDLALRRARSGRSVLALVAGAPGQGKTRLVEEFLARADGSLTVLAARCRPAGENGSRNVLRQLLAADAGDGVERIRERIASLIPDRDDASRVATWIIHSAGVSAESIETLGVEERQDEVADAWRRYLAALAVERPLVVWLEDVHWSEPELVRLIDRLTNGARIPLLVIATARPEFAEQAGLRPSGDRVFIEVDALDVTDAVALARLAGAEDGASAARGEGNPLFIIELARVRETTGSLPLTLQGAIGARLDDLAPADRELLSRCAIVGETFTSREAALLTQRDAADVERTLDLLVDRQYLEPMQRGYRFHHALVRDVAYQRLPIAERMRLHARFARTSIDVADAEMRAHHLWEAIRPPDGEWVWEDAHERDAIRSAAFEALMEAGARYVQRFAHAAALAAYERAGTLAVAAPERARAERSLGDAFRAQVASEEAWAHYRRARDAYRETGAVPAAVYADLLRLVVAWPGGFRTLPPDEEVRAVVEEGEAAARASGDVVSLASVMLDRAALALRTDPEHAERSVIDEAVALLGRAGFPAGSTDLLVAVADLQLYSLHDPAGAARTRQQIDALIARGARVADEDSYLNEAVMIAADLGKLDEARAAAEVYRGAMAHRGAHLLSHAIGSRAYVAWCAGEDDVVFALAARATALLDESPATRFCMGGVGGALRGAATYLLLAGRTDEARDYVRRALSTTLAPFRDVALIVPQAMLGEIASVDRGLDAARTNVPFFAALALCILERWDDLPELLDRFDRWAAKGGAPPFGAFAAAIREEMAAAKGGPAPRHEQLHALGFHGWSRLVRFRVPGVARP